MILTSNHAYSVLVLKALVYARNSTDVKQSMARHKGTLTKTRKGNLMKGGKYMHNVFNEGPRGYSDIAKTSEKCQRDFEGAITRLNKINKVTSDLKAAVEAYTDVVGTGDREFTLPSLYGNLCLSNRSAEKEIDSLTAEWQAEIDRANK